MYLAAYVKPNGVFMVRKVPKSGYWLIKYTFGKDNLVQVRINAAVFEKLESCSSFRESWDMAQTILGEKLDELNAKKKLRTGGNC